MGVFQFVLIEEKARRSNDTTEEMNHTWLISGQGDNYCQCLVQIKSRRCLISISLWDEEVIKSVTHQLCENLSLHNL